MSDANMINIARFSFNTDISRELSLIDDINDLRKQNNSTHERIFAKLKDIENQKNSTIRKIQDDINDLRKQNNSTHERIFNKITELEKREEAQNIRHEHNLEKLNSLVNDVQEIKDKPVKQINAIIEKIVTILVSTLVGVILAKFGLS